MKTIHRLLGALLITATILTGCQSPQAGTPYANGMESANWNNSYSLLHQLLNEQKNVGLLCFIKRQEEDVKTLVKKIAGDSAAGAKLLEEFARHEPAINLDDIRLPPGEAATREAIAATKKQELFSQKGDEFELSLLLTQHEALSYAWHLATVAAKTEPEPERARALTSVGADMEKLYREVYVLLLSKTKGAGTNQPELTSAP